MATLLQQDAARHKDHINEDKLWWVKHGKQMERAFLRLADEAIANPSFDLNPDKDHDCDWDTAPDLIVNQRLRADLKVQQTPFFKAGALHNVDPNFAVTFNIKDYLRYQANYPDIALIFWVQWERGSMKGFHVDNHDAIYAIRLDAIRQMVAEDALSVCHYKQRRTNRIIGADNEQKEHLDVHGNAKSSYVLDLRLMTRLWAGFVPGHGRRTH